MDLQKCLAAFNSRGFNMKHQTSEVGFLFLDPREIPEPPEVKDAILFSEEGIFHQYLLWKKSTRLKSAKKVYMNL